MITDAAETSADEVVWDEENRRWIIYIKSKSKLTHGSISTD